MKKVTGAVVLALLLFVARDAAAVPVIDGINSVGEWTTGLVINAADFNEGGIPDAYDFKRMAMKVENSGGSDDGLYILFELWDTPTLAQLPEIGADDPFYRTTLDLNGDSLFSGNDRRIDFNFGGSGTIVVKDGSLVVVTDTGTDVDLDSAVEIFIPKDMFSSFPLGSFQTFARLDNGGEPADDRVPDAGFSRTIPEPASMILFGSGLLGALGLRRKRNAS